MPVRVVKATQSPFVCIYNYLLSYNCISCRCCFFPNDSVLKTPLDLSVCSEQPEKIKLKREIPVLSID
jgi:hypothetical protein